MLEVINLKLKYEKSFESGGGGMCRIVELYAHSHSEENAAGRVELGQNGAGPCRNGIHLATLRLISQRKWFELTYI